MPDADQTKTQADELYDQMEYAKMVELLEPFKDGGDADLLWRLAAAVHELHKKLPSDKEKLAKLEEGVQTLRRALELDGKNASCHKWMGKYLIDSSLLQGNKAQVEQSPVIKEHLLKACEYGPSDPINWHRIGMWCFSVADISWATRKIATVIYGEPPKASFQEALDYFLKAEEAKAGSYSLNLVMIGHAYNKLQDKENAIKYAKMGRDYTVKTFDDEEAHKEAVALLKDLGVKE